MLAGKSSFDRSADPPPPAVVTARLLFGPEESSSALPSPPMLHPHGHAPLVDHGDGEDALTHLHPLATRSLKRSRRKSHLTETEMRLLMAAKCGRCQLQVTLTGSCGCPPRKHSRRYSSAAHQHRNGKG